MVTTWWTNGLLIVGGLAWLVLIWGLVITGSIWGIRRLLAGALPSPVMWAAVVVTPIVMVAGGWIAYGIYRLARPGGGWATSPPARASVFGFAALGCWALATSIAESFAMDFQSHPQPGQEAWAIVFRWIPVAPLVLGSFGITFSWLRGGRGWHLANGLAQGAFWGALVVLFLVVPKPN